VHFGLFAAFTMLLFWARADFQPAPFLLPLAGFAVATELMQFLVDGRQPDAFDVMLNLAGIGTATLAAWGVSRMRLRMADG
jgi:glycopeptide antibiotics resistance protein